MATATGKTEQVPTEDTTAEADEEQKGRSDDKCMGNRRVRTIILSILLLVFSIFAAGHLFASQELFSDNKDAPNMPAPVHDYVNGGYNAYNVIVSGLIFILVFSIVTIVLFFIPKCEGKQGRIPGLFLILGGVLYLCGWIAFISAQKDYIYDELTPDGKEDMDAIWLGWFGEALLYSGCAIFLGVDVLLLLFDSEGKRLFLNLGIICIVSILTMPAYFILSDNDNVDGAEAIGVGYLFLFGVTLAYIILYVFTCCTCGIRDRTITRIILCIFMVLGGLITAIGYWVFAGGSDAAMTLGSDDDEAKRVAYYIGYTIFIGGLVGAWTLDMAFDDIQGHMEVCCKCCRGPVSSSN
eukprot:180135_1